MEKLLKQKLDSVNELKLYTKDIMNSSTKLEYTKIDLLLEDRQKYIEKIDSINEQINEYEHTAYEDKEIQKLKSEIREVFKEIYEMDNSIRKNINNELVRLRNVLNQPQASTKGLNVKA